MATNLQTFAGEVEIPEGNLQLKRILELSANTSSSSNTGILISRNLGASSDSNVIVYYDEDQPALRFGHTLNAASDETIVMDEANNFTINVFGDVEASFFKGDGGLLSNLVTDFQSVSEFGATTDQQVTLSNVVTGLNVSVGNVLVAGNVTATTFIGDGSQLDNIASTLEEIILNGNVTSNIVEFRNATSLVTTGMVGVGNLFPEHTLAVGSNLWVDDARTDGNTLSVQGNAYISHKLTLGSIEILPGYSLQQTSNLGNTTTNTLEFNNATTAFVTQKMAGIGIQPNSADVGVAGLHVDGHLRLGGPANTDENSDVYLRSAGQLNLNANDTDTDNQYTGLVLRAGNSNESNITIEGALSDATKQHITFATKNTERMRIDEHGNVGINVDPGDYKLNVGGEANVLKLTTTSLTINTIPLSIIYQLDDILENGNVTTNVATFGKVSVSDPTLATTASNLVTWNATTQEFEDSGGLISNKLSIVSEQPPAALTGDSTVVDGHGRYKVTASSEGSINNHPSWQTFNKTNAQVGGGYSSNVSYATTSPYAHTGGMSLGGVTGEWVQLELPYKTKLRHISLQSRDGNVLNMPSSFSIIGSNDNTSWTTLGSFSGITGDDYTDDVQKQFVVDATEHYKYYAIVVTNIVGNADNGRLILGEWRLFTESFAIDGGKVEMASAAITGGNTVVDQTGPHARGPVPLRKYPEVPLTSNVGVGGYVASASDENNNTTNAAYGAFDGISNDLSFRWRTDDLYVNNESTATPSALKPSSPQTQLDTNTSIGEYLIIKLPSKIKLKNIVVNAPNMHMPYEVDIYGRNESTWTHVKNYTYEIPSGTDTGAWNTTNQTIDATEYYLEYAFVVVKTNGQEGASIGELELYGYEETSDPDTSVDTTITSQFNLPDTTGVKLYIDGDKGSTPTDYSGEGHTLTDNSESFSGNAWSFSSLTTSNVTMSTGDFAMEGTHPHSVSLWFNCANVTSNATLFHVGTEAGEADAKTAISLTETGHLGWIDGGDNQFLTANTWHNLVYATQGGGGLRTCYLDGRKLGDVQVQDTSGEYPSFAMTGNSQYGYRVSASSEYLTDSNNKRPAWGAHNPTVSYTTSTTAGVWMTDFSKYSSSSPYAAIDGDTFTDSDGGTHNGHWNKIEMPHKLVPSSVYFTNGGTFSSTRLATIWVILGSNDDTNWDLLLSSTTTLNQATQTFPINTSTGYKYLMFLCKNINGEDALVVEHMRFYGHKENDFTRFPFSTVVKYPHIAMTGYVHRGYVVTASNETLSDGDRAWHVFDEDNSTYWKSDEKYTSAGVENTSSGLTDTSSTEHGGEYIILESPRKLKITGFNLTRDGLSASRSPGSIAFLGKNSAPTVTTGWTLIAEQSTSTYTNDVAPLTISGNSNYFKYHAVVIRSIDGNGLRFQIKNIELLGTEEDLDVVARVGEGLDGKIANFRVYDKYLREEQALELWDAQKDQFGRATSSVSVYRGHVGIGTTEPEAALTVMDEAHESEEFPPRAMTDYETYMDGHGVFSVNDSSVRSGEDGAYALFTKDDGTLKFWHSNNSSTDHRYTQDAAGTYSGTSSFDGISGEWVTLECPYSIKLDSIKLHIRVRAGSALLAYQDQSPEDWTLLGSNDGGNWETLKVVTGQIISGTGTSFDVGASQYYKMFALVITRIANNVAGSYTNALTLGEWRLFGTRERGQSTLHDGELKLTKNLTVPRIGPPLDADDTPRRDRLVVEYNTSTNPTENGGVRDTSGRGNDGVFVGTATYDVTEKAFTFPGSGMNTIQKHNLGPNLKGNQPLTVSLWFKTNEDRDQTLFNVLPGDSIETTRKTFGVRTEGNSTNYNLRFYYWNSDYVYNASELHGPQGKWFHLVAMNVGGTKTANGTTYDFGDPSNRRLFLNGVELFTPSSTYSSAVSGTASDLLDLEPNSRLIIGARFKNDGEYPLNGSISNFKLYDVALTADEVKRLYDMGRLGNVIAQPVHIAAPLYAPGVPVQFVSAQVHDKVAYSSAGSIHIDRLDLSIKPHFSNSKIYLIWRIEYEAHHDNVFRIYRDGVQIGYNTVSGQVDHSGVTTASYDNNTDSTPQQAMITWIDSPNTTSTVTYQVYSAGSNANYAIWLNRTAGSTGGGGNENGVSQKTAMEIAQ